MRDIMSYQTNVVLDKETIATIREKLAEVDVLDDFPLEVREMFEGKFMSPLEWFNECIENESFDYLDSYESIAELIYNWDKKLLAEGFTGELDDPSAFTETLSHLMSKGEVVGYDEITYLYADFITIDYAGKVIGVIRDVVEEVTGLDPLNDSACLEFPAKNEVGNA